MVKFDISRDDARRLDRIMKRAAARFEWTKDQVLNVRMSVIAVHANGNPIDFAKLEAFDDFNLSHDLGGMDRIADAWDEDPQADPDACTSRHGHRWVCRDDDEEISYCENCGADGNG